MITRNILFFIAVITGFSAFAQDDMVIQGVSPDLHLSHKVAAKETWYSVGRIYNLSPKEIAAYNKLKIDKPLEIGQAVRVPLTSANFSQNESKGAGEVLVPLYHVVQDKEWLYRISVNHNKVPVESLEKWNSISKDDAKPGMRLIVGYLKVKQANATLATKAGSETPPATTRADKPENKPQTPVKKEMPVVTTDTKKPAPAVEENSASVPASGNKGGYFKTLFDESGKNSAGLSGIFKSSSGWNDGKYYALMNNVAIGTIIKVNFPSTSKTIYAKVLGELPDMKESAGLSVRISDAAANELGAVNNKFPVEVRY